MLPAGVPSVQVELDAANIITKIPESIFGNNANSWMSDIVSQQKLLGYINSLQSHIIRFPGGSISDMYFWNQPEGVLPADVPDQLIDASGNKIKVNYWQGKNNASWTISVDKYYQMLQQTGNSGMITVNYGYARYGTSGDPVAAAAHMAADWVRYDQGRTKYWEVGNEDNGTWEAGYRIDLSKNKDGQPEIITGDIYGKHFNVFADSMKKAAQEVRATIFIGAQLLELQPQSWQTSTDQGWNATVIARVGNKADFYINHSYYTPYQQNSSASVILNSAISNTAAMINWYHSSLGSAVRPLALTEWNINAEGSMQKVSFISGMHATLLLGELLKNKYGMAGRWDLANAWENGNDHGLFNNGDEPGAAQWNPRPTFYYLYYFRKMAGDRLVNATVSGSSEINAYATTFSSGEKSIILINRGTTSQVVGITVKNAKAPNHFYWYTLTGGTDNGEFSRKVFVNNIGPSGISGGPDNYTMLNAYGASAQSGIKVALPGRSVIYMVIN